MLSPTSSIFLTLPSGTNIQKMSRRLKFCYQYQKIVTIITSPTLLSPQTRRPETGRSGVFKQFWRSKVRVSLTVVPSWYRIALEFRKISKTFQKMCEECIISKVLKRFWNWCNLISCRCMCLNVLSVWNSSQHLRGHLKCAFFVHQK